VRLRLLAIGVVAAAVAPLLAPVGSGAGAAVPAGRQSRDSRVAIAGGDIYVWSSHNSEDSGSGCTTAFVVRSISSHAFGILTAGHCVSTLSGGPAYEVHQTERLSGDDTKPGDLLGVVTASHYTVGDSGDSAFVQLASGIREQPMVFSGGMRSHSSIPVVGVAAVKAGEKVCYSGAATGEHCGFTVVGWPQTVAFGSSRAHAKISIGNEWRATGTHCTSRKGDSGSPVYIRRGGVAYAVGILSGGQEKANSCPFYFTPVTLALRHLGLRLVKTTA
jgi:V8-like Glu-specific endopeptidase